MTPTERIVIRALFHTRRRGALTALCAAVLSGVLAAWALWLDGPASFLVLPAMFATLLLACLGHWRATGANESGGHL